uniref:Reverse transcriptase zinc-binding domain-containing protein n=1 Tax=Arundo donax TaxID=35708 RepID=A0A0A9H1T8_ARUDO
MVAWEKVCRPVELGGLGILNLCHLGQTLLMRWQWLSRTDLDRPWSVLAAKPDHEMVALFEASTSVQLGDGQSCLFWKDKWIDGRSIESLAPNLILIVPRRVRNQRTTFEALQNCRWVRDIWGGLTSRSYLNTSHYGRLWKVFPSSWAHGTHSFGNGRLQECSLHTRPTALSLLGNPRS